MKWEKPSGISIQTNDDEATIKYCKSLGWVEAETEPVEPPEEPKASKKKKDVSGN